MININHNKNIMNIPMNIPNKNNISSLMVSNIIYSFPPLIIEIHFIYHFLIHQQHIQPNIPDNKNKIFPDLKVFLLFCRCFDYKLCNLCRNNYPFFRHRFFRLTARLRLIVPTVACLSFLICCM